MVELFMEHLERSQAQTEALLAELRLDDTLLAELRVRLDDTRRASA